MSPSDFNVMAVLSLLTTQGVIHWTDAEGGQLTSIPNDAWDNAVAKLSLAGSSAVITSTLRKRDGVQISNSCFNSGSWAKQAVLKNHVDDACNAFNGGFLGNGSKLVWKARDKNSEDDDMWIVFTEDIKLWTRAAQDTCGNALRQQIMAMSCSGASEDTRGGTATVKDLQNNVLVLYSLDPTTDNCNC